jgi:hypothetical protein
MTRTATVDWLRIVRFAPNRDKNFTPAKVKRRLSDIEASIKRYLSKLDAADRNEPALPPAKVAHLQERIIKLKEQMQELKAIEAKVQAAPDGTCQRF